MAADTGKSGGTPSNGAWHATPRRAAQGGDGALRQAISLVHVPTLAHRLRTEPLAEGVDLLLAIAAGDASAKAEAVALSERDPETIRQAAAFYIQQVLLGPDADHYRILAATPTASRAVLRRNFTHLMRWLHPDIERDGGQAVFFGRVKAAWDVLGTPERRAAYDASLAAAYPGPKRPGPKRPGNSLDRGTNPGTRSKLPGHRRKSGPKSKPHRQSRTKTTAAASAGPGLSALRPHMRPRPLLVRALARLFGARR